MKKWLKIVVEEKYRKLIQFIFKDFVKGKAFIGEYLKLIRDIYISV